MTTKVRKVVLLGGLISSLAAGGYALAAQTPKPTLLYSFEQAKQELGFGSRPRITSADHDHSSSNHPHGELANTLREEQVPLQAAQAVVPVEHLPERFRNHRRESIPGLQTAENSWVTWDESGTRYHTISGPDNSFLTIRYSKSHSYTPIVADLEWQRHVKNRHGIEGVLYQFKDNPMLRIRAARRGGDDWHIYDILTQGITEEEILEVFNHMAVSH